MMMADIMEGIVGPVDLHAEAKKHLETDPRRHR